MFSSVRRAPVNSTSVTRMRETILGAKRRIIIGVREGNVCRVVTQSVRFVHGTVGLVPPVDLGKVTSFSLILSRL